MRIGVVTTSYPRSPGDPAGGFVAEHAAWLARAGHAVEVIAAGPGAAGSAGGVAVERVGGAGLFYDEGAPNRLARAPLAAWPAALRFAGGLALAVRRRAPAWDAVIAHWLVPSGLAAALAARRPLLVIAHSGDVHLVRRLRLARPLAALLVRAGARWVFVADPVRRHFLAGLGGPLAAAVAAASLVSPMGVEVARLAAAAAPRTAGAPPRVLFLGRLVPIKGVPVLLEAMTRLAGRAQLVIAGAGPEAAALAAQARALGLADVELTGEVRGADRDRLLAAADLLVLPSRPVEGGRSEGLPVTALEAMAAGVAVIASRTGGLAELPAAAVRLVEPGQPIELAAAIRELLDDAPRRARQIAAARELVAGFDWERVGPRMLAHLLAE